MYNKGRIRGDRVVGQQSPRLKVLEIGRMKIFTSRCLKAPRPSADLICRKLQHNRAPHTGSLSDVPPNTNGQLWLHYIQFIT